MDTQIIHLPVKSIQTGATCSSDIRNEYGVLLLGRGERITDSFRDQLLQRGVDYIDVSPSQAAELQASNTAAQRHTSRKRDAAHRFLENRIDRSSENYSADRADQITGKIVKSIAAIARLGSHISQASDYEVERLCLLPQDFLGMLLDDGDQAIAGLKVAQRDNKLATRCTGLSMLSIYTAIEMELTFDEVVLAGTAGLLHDISLFACPPRLRCPKSTLSNDEKWEYQRHPLQSRDLLAEFPKLSVEVTMLVSQVHERIDGSGFPRGLRKPHCHPLTPILTVADTYLSLIGPGPGRPPLRPHDAICVLMNEVDCGRLDPETTQAFVTQLTLYPIGSRVMLSNEKLATVVRRDGLNYTEPIVQIDGDDKITQISQSNLKVARALASPGIRELDLPREMIPEMTIEELIG